MSNVISVVGTNHLSITQMSMVNTCEFVDRVQKRYRKMSDSTDDTVDHPPHYTAHPSGIECITITEHMNFCIGNAVKYLWRADLKNGVEDLRKAVWYIQREIARRENA